jgi:hypothetical protein
MFINILFLAIIIIPLAGFGSVLTGHYSSSEIGFCDQTLIGLLAVTAIGLVLNFFTPLHLYIALGGAAAGAACFALNRRRMWCSLGEHPILMLLALGVLLLMCAVGAVITPLSYDTGLYHLQAIEWIEHSAKVFGLANLHSRLGFNTIWFVHGAMFDLTRTGHRGIFLLNPAIFVVMMGAMLQPMFERHWGAAVRTSDIFAAIVAVLFLVNAKHLVFDWMSASPGYDLPSSLMAIYAFWAFLRMFETKSGSQGRFVLLLASSVAAVAVKLSAAPVLLLLPGAIFHLSHKRELHITQVIGDPVVACLVVVGTAWIAAGVASSGCLAFPAASTCLTGLPWAVPQKDVGDIALTISAWARSPDQHYLQAATGWSWLETWPRTMLAKRAFLPGTAWTLAAIAFLGLGMAAIDRYLGQTRFTETHARPAAWSAGFATLVGCIGVALWFITAPDPRFGVGFLLATPALAVAWGIRCMASGVGFIGFATGGVALTGLVAVCSGWFIVNSWANASQAEKSWPSIPAVVVKERALGQQFRVNVPVGSDQCWDAPRPCAPNNFPGLPLKERRIVFWRALEPDSTAAVPGHQ